MFSKQIYRDGIDEIWFIKYTELRKFCPYMINIIDLNVQNLTIVMERLQGPTVDKIYSFWNHDEINRFALFLMEFIFTLEEVRIFNHYYGIHLDLSLDNIIFEKSQFVIIDPDSFRFEKYFDYRNYNFLLHQLDKIFQEDNLFEKKNLLREYNLLMDQFQSYSILGQEKEKFFVMKNKYVQCIFS